MPDISFKQVPSNIRVPGAYIEVDNSQAVQGLQPLNYRTLVIGQRLPSGSIAEGIPTLVTSRQQAIQYFGRGSNLALMLGKLFDNSPFVEKYAIALDDVGTAATGSLALTGTATSGGAISLYIGGERVQAIVSVGDTASDVGDSLAQAVTDNPDLPVTAVNTTGTVTFTAKNAGELGNEIDLRLNYLGDLGGERLPDGISAVVTPMSGGATNPDVNVALSALPDEIFNYWCSPYSDAANLNAIEAELDRRWGPTVQLEGHYFGARSGTVSELSTLGATRNNEHMSLLDAHHDSPTPSFLWAAAFVGQVAESATIDPARPFTTLPLLGVKAPPQETRRTQTEQNTLLYDGMATHQVTRFGEVQIQRAITNFQENAAGVPDASYLDSQTLLTLSYLRQTFRARMLQRFNRFKLADDGTRFAIGQAIVTPKSDRGQIHR